MKKLSILSLLFLLHSCGRAQDQDCCNPELFSQVIATVQDNHIRPLAIDDSLSVAVFHHFLSKLEEEKGLLTESEINQLKAYQFEIDDDMLNHTNHFFEAAYALWSAGLEKKRKPKAEWYHALINSYLAVNDYQSTFCPLPKRKSGTPLSIAPWWERASGLISPIPTPDNGSLSRYRHGKPGG
ncbi:MAG: hypothetical protein H6573_23435 [Lewinellaceae bacterium]|nr:hypothetical protein [Lewinellaceae bacterium]